MDFSQFGLSPVLEAAVQATGYTAPTPIQNQAIPFVLEGRDVIGLAQTGTGKTAAFVLPILHHLLTRPRRALRVLVLVPTRELAEQVLSVFKTFSEGTEIRSIAIYGGVSMNEQIKKLKLGTHIVVACPGRLLDHIRQNTISLSKIEHLVLDEADQMFEHGFLPDVRRIIRNIPDARQTMLFSATMPKEIKDLAIEVLNDPLEVRAGGDSAPAATVDHGLIPVESEKKTDLLVNILSGNGVGSVLVFTRTKHRAERLAKQLVRSGFSTTTLQGNLSQNRRLRSINGFRSGEYQILVATDIAARGIDVPNVTHVINYDIPETPEAYTHRIGRTGRASQVGEAMTFVSRDDARQLRLIERTIGATIPNCELEGYEPEFAIDRSRTGGGDAAPRGRGQQQRPQRSGHRNGQRSGQRSGQRNDHRGGNGDSQQPRGPRGNEGSRPDAGSRRRPRRGGSGGGARQQSGGFGRGGERSSSAGAPRQ